ncbi:hypothetical protein G4B88_010169 [Cannabis sativa]|uniref:Sugar phosphate transporter domain-containing protein n=1 Tax=Cannabis sativa TaxID=3483 RepID=A0A7J6E536_CANSA|nr:hypothetical protein G4B88_010169 [Cannabis sativa]
MNGPLFWADERCFILALPKQKKVMGEGERFQLGTVGALTLSVVSSVSIVICNKALISSLGFNFGRNHEVETELFWSLVGVSTYNATTLTSWHLLVTFCSLHAARKMKFFEHKAFEQKAVMGFGILNGISIGLLNLSLGFNSVGFYQMTKLAIIPCTVFLETLFLAKKFRIVQGRSIQLSLLILLLGVGIATVNDVQLNALGSILSLLAIVTTCVAQIMTNTIQKKFKVSSTQLLYQSCPYQAGTLLISGPFLDQFLTNQNVFAFKYTTQVLVFIVLSCMISVSVNFSTFLVIGKTSPVTYQVLGHLKTCLVLAFGYILLHDPFNWRNILGIMVALVGMIVYSYFCTRESQKKTDEATLPSSQGKEGESDPLLKTGNGNDVVIDTVAQKAPGWERNKDLHA